MSYALLSVAEVYIARSCISWSSWLDHCFHNLMFTVLQILLQRCTSMLQQHSGINTRSKQTVTKRGQVVQVGSNLISGHAKVSREGTITKHIIHCHNYVHAAKLFNPKCWRCFQSPQNLKHIQNTALWYVCICDHYSPKDVYPNCLQTTWASRLSHPLPHTVPHSLSTQISTLPSLWLDPPTKRIWPWEQFAGAGINSTVPNHKWCFTCTWKFDDGNHYFCLFQFLVFKLEFTAVDFYTYIYILYIRLSKYFQFIKRL